MHDDEKPFEFKSKIRKVTDIYPEVLQELVQPIPSIKLSDWPQFNEIVGGFRANEFTVFCGPTGTGKTTFMANISAQLMKQKENHLVMSVECGANDYVKRIFSVVYGKDINRGDVIPVKEMQEISKVVNQKISISSLCLGLYESRIPLEVLKQEITESITEHDCKLVIIDNLNFILKVTRSADQIVEMDRVTHDLIEFCKIAPVHIIMIMHPKKTDHGRVESEFDIKGSSTAVQEAHNVILFNKPSKKQLESGERKLHDREIHIAKLRRRGEYTGAKIFFKSDETRYLEIV